ncbi:MAG: single-stranded DNA-binding protein [Bacilli bacterium]
MAGLNRVVLVGRIVRDPELRKTNSGISLTSFTIAVDNPGKEKSTSFIPCTCWNKTAEIVAKYCVKGSLVGVDGRLSQRNYEDKNGQKRSVVEVVGESVQFLEKKGASTEDASQPDDNGSSSISPATHEGIDGADDDLPF